MSPPARSPARHDLPAGKQRRQHVRRLADSRLYLIPALRSVLFPFLMLAMAHAERAFGISTYAGVPGVEAEAELLAAMTLFFERVGLTSGDVGIKVSSRKVLQSVMERYGVPEAAFAQVCVIVDKIEKLPREKVEQELAAIDVPPQTVDNILKAMQVGCVLCAGASDHCPTFKACCDALGTDFPVIARGCGSHGMQLSVEISADAWCTSLVHFVTHFHPVCADSVPR